MVNISKGCIKKAVVKIILVIVIFALVVPVFAMEGHKTYTFSGGEGTKKEPFLISNSKDLFTLSQALTTVRNSDCLNEPPINQSSPFTFP